MGVSVSSLPWVQDAHATAAALFGLGVGWNVSFIAVTAELSARTAPSERGSLLGFNDLVSAATGAGLTLLGGLALTYAGVAALAIGAAALLVIPALWIVRHSPSDVRDRSAGCNPRRSSIKAPFLRDAARARPAPSAVRLASAQPPSC
jgi:hypothetical protein